MGQHEYPVAVVLRAEATSAAEEDALEPISSWWTRTKGWTPGRRCWWEPLPEEPPYPSREARPEDDNPEAAYWGLVEARYSALQRAWDLLGEHENHRKCSECRGIATLRLAFLAEHLEDSDSADVVRQCETCRAKGAGRKVTYVEPVLYRASRTAYPRINVVRRSAPSAREVIDVFRELSDAATVKEMSQDHQVSMFFTLDLLGAPALMIAEETGYTKGTISKRLKKAREEDEKYNPTAPLFKRNTNKGEGRRWLPSDPGSDFVKTRKEAACEWCRNPGAQRYLVSRAPLARVQVERIEEIPPDLSSPTWAGSVWKHNAAPVVGGSIRRAEGARRPISDCAPPETIRRMEVATVRICDACAKSPSLRRRALTVYDQELRRFPLSEDLLDRLIKWHRSKNEQASPPSMAALEPKRTTSTELKYEKQLAKEDLGVVEIESDLPMPET